MPTSRRHAPALLGALAAAAASLVVLAPPAHADGPTTFTSTTPIAVPPLSDADQQGQADPYPSTITVAGLSGPVSNVTVTLTGVTHGFLNDLDVLLVAPDGQNLTLLSDVGDPDSLSFAEGADLTFSDAAGGPVPDGLVPSGTYRPTDVDNGVPPDTFPSPAPAPSSSTTLAGAFTGTTASGAWRLYAVDDNTGDAGSIAGWSLTLTTTAAAAATTTSVSASPNPSQTGSGATFTATVTSSGSQVSDGSVRFTDNGNVLGTVPVSGAGTASWTTSSLTEGSHQIVATYLGTSAYLTSNGSVTQVVDRPTVVNNARWSCNPGGITVPASGSATPYASRIQISGQPGTVYSTEVVLNGLRHTSPVDLDVMLVSPDGDAVTLMSDTGGTVPVTGAQVFFRGGAPALTTLSSGSSGSYGPTDDDTDGQDSFPAPAPATSGATFAALRGGAPNGTWSLYVHDDATGDSGRINGWCVRVVSQVPTATQLAVQPGNGPEGTKQTLAATVTSGGQPVPFGDVDFYATTRGVRSLVGTATVNSSGVAQLTDQTFSVGIHNLRAFYKGQTLGTVRATKSASGFVALRIAPIANAGGPYTVTEGQSLTLSTAGSTANPGTTYTWDLNNDGTYGDTTGPNPTVTWAELSALGIVPGRQYRIWVKVLAGGLGKTDSAVLTTVAAP